MQKPRYRLIAGFYGDPPEIRTLYKPFNNRIYLHFTKFTTKSFSIFHKLAAFVPRLDGYIVSGLWKYRHVP